MHLRKLRGLEAWRADWRPDLCEDLCAGAGGRGEDQSHHFGDGDESAKTRMRGQMWGQSKRHSQHDLVTSWMWGERGKVMLTPAMTK